MRSQILSVAEYPYIESIINATRKNNELDLLFETDRTSFFYNDKGEFLAQNNKGKLTYEEQYFDKCVLRDIRVAYSCISIEHWILLHFERSNTPFYNSREIINFFDNNQYFDCKYEKGWYFYANRECNVLKDFFCLVNQSIRNNLWLIADMQKEINNEKKYYEINPFSDVCYLAAKLFNQNIENPDKPTNINELDGLTISNNSMIISIQFTYRRKQSQFCNEIMNCFSIIDINGCAVDVERNCSHDIIRTGDIVIVKLGVRNFTENSIIIEYSENYKHENCKVLWFLCM